MPAKSKSQRHLMGYAYSVKKAGKKSKKSKKYKEASQSVKDLADSMTLDQLKDFATTKEKGLPKKVKKKKKKASKTNESYSTKHVKLFEDYNSVLEQNNNQYKVVGYKFEMFGSYRVDIRVVDTKTSEIVLSVSGEGDSLEKAYKIAGSNFVSKAKELKLNVEPPKPKELKVNENVSIDESHHNRDIVLQHKHRRNVKIVLKLQGPKIVEIENETKWRFPYQIGQHYNMGFETWACNNQFTIDGRDTCPKEKIFGINVDDIPQGHEFRYLYPHKFKN